MGILSGWRAAMIRGIGILILLLPWAVTTVQAQTAALPQLQSADPLVAELFRQSASTGMVVVVVRDNETWMQSYGQTYPGSHQKPNADSLLRLCSLTKIMTTDLLVKLAADGRVSLSDPLQKFAPRNVIVPVRTVRGLSGPPITLRDLATHTAGLPREIAYPTGDAGHFTFPDYNFRWQWLPGYRCVSSRNRSTLFQHRVRPPGRRIISRCGQTLPAALCGTNCQTPWAAGYDAEPNSRRVRSSSDRGKNEGVCSDTTAAAGSGGMYSTANDMTRWLKYLLNLPGVPMHQDPAATATYIPASELRWTQGLGAPCSQLHRPGLGAPQPAR